MSIKEMKPVKVIFKDSSVEFLGVKKEQFLVGFEVHKCSNGLSSPLIRVSKDRTADRHGELHEHVYDMTHFENSKEIKKVIKDYFSKLKF